MKKLDKNLLSLIEKEDSLYEIAKENAERLIQELRDGDKIDPEKWKKRVTF
jgi:hypothetical protein